jgi:hypothetical protein
METTKNQLTPYESNFFNKLKIYLDTPLYFYGSIQRDDYKSGYSDIDIDIFTENMNSTIVKLQNFFNSNQYKKIIIKPQDKKGIINGYKFKYSEPENNFKCEIAVYDIKNKDEILQEHGRKEKLPFIISILLVFLKTLYYNIGIVPKEIYLKTKNYIMDLVDTDYKGFLSF